MSKHRGTRLLREKEEDDIPSITILRFEKKHFKPLAEPW